MKNFLFGAITILIILAIFEGVAFFLSLSRWDENKTISSSRHLYSPYRGHELNPIFSHKESTLGKKIHSKQGFRRDGEIDKIKPPGVFRIFALGGSALYGIGAGSGYPFHRDLLNTETVDYHLERLIQKEFDKQKKKYTKVEVVNAGVTAYWTFQHVIYLMESIFEYSPDMVIFLDGHNDFYTYKKFNHLKDYGYSSRVLSDSFNRRYFIFTSLTVFRYLGKYSYFFAFIERMFETLWEKYNAGESLRRDSLTDASCEVADFDNQYKNVNRNGFIRSYYMLKGLSEYYKFEMKVFLQPEILFEEERSLSLGDQNLKNITTKFINCPEQELAHRKRIRELLPDIFREIKVDYSDVSTIAPETRNQKPETRNQKPETRNQKPETRNQKICTWIIAT